MNKPVDRTGKRYGSLVALARLPSKKDAFWLCRCDCGAETIKRANHLASGLRSCGCRGSSNRTGLVSAKVKDKADARLVRIWRNMHARCTYEETPYYQWYGGRGIAVCSDWRAFDTFKAWAVECGYNDKLSIDRIDVNGDYKPDNCRWSSDQEQGQNTTRNVLNQERVRQLRSLHASGASVSAIASELGVASRTVSSVLRGRTWTNVH